MLGRAICRRGPLADLCAIVSHALVPAQTAALITAQETRCERRKLTGTIGFEEGLAEKSEGLKPRQNLSQLLFGFGAAQDQMRMVGSGRERARNFEARMAGLNGLLG